MNIGCNFNFGIKYGGLKSSFGGIFTNEKVQIQGGFMDTIYCQIGNINDAYTDLKQKISQNFDEKDIPLYVYQVVNNYFGDYSNIDNRMNYYPTGDELDNDDSLEMGKVSNLKGKNAGVCVERAMLSQNLLKTMGIESYYKTSGILNNDNREIHAYNIIKLLDKYYIFDATMPKEENSVITPLICEIPKEVFKCITSPEQNTGYAVETSYYNPLRKEYKHIIYDPNHNDLLYKTNKHYVK